jgi:hypothetical protein
VRRAAPDDAVARAGRAVAEEMGPMRATPRGASHPLDYNHRPDRRGIKGVDFKNTCQSGVEKSRRRRRLERRCIQHL